MHRKKWSKGFKKMLSIGTIAIVLVPNVSQALPKNNLSNIKPGDREIIHDLNTNSIIQEDVDIKTDEQISVIVEFSELPMAVAKNTKNKNTIKANIEYQHEKFKQFLSQKSKEASEEKNEFSYKIEHEYKHVFNGVSMNIKGSDVEKLLESGVVKSIWNNGEVKIDLPKEEIKSNPDVSPLMGDSIPHIGVDKLHKEGLKGAGVKVGVLDTGIDYNHPDLKDNYKGGYDFVDNDNDPMETTYKNWQDSGEPEFRGSSAYYTSHGTHVSGTIAGSGKNVESEFATVGVAPEADLYAYRVLGPYGGGSFAGIVAAIEKSYLDGMDVINLSLGADTNSAINPVTASCNNAMIGGVVTVIANGNAGPNDSTVGMPGAAPLPISVGASNVTTQLEMFELKSQSTTASAKILAKDFKTSLESITNRELDVIDCGLGTADELANIDLIGKVALIKRGDISLDEKIMNAKAKGAISVIMYNNVAGEIPYYMGEGSGYLPSIAITQEVGEKLKVEANSETGLKVNLTLSGTVSNEGDELANFSSRGPADTEDIKPDIVAPGVSILSTYPEYINHKEDGEDYSIAYSRISGTSMASPHIAGVAALIEQEGKNTNKNYSTSDVKTKIMNSGEAMKEAYAVNEIGTGRVDAYSAVHSDVSIQVLDKDVSLDGNFEEIVIDDITASLSYKYLVQKEDGSEAKKTIDTKIKNNSDKSKTFEVSVEYLGSEHGSKDALKNGVKIDIENSITVGAGSEKIVKPTIVIPNSAELGLYQGNILLKDGQETYRVPFTVKSVKEGFDSVIDEQSISGEVELIGRNAKGIDAIVDIGSPIEYIDLIIKDYDTDKPIAYSGSVNAKGIKPGKYKIENIVARKTMAYPINEKGQIEHVVKTLGNGKYKVELQVVTEAGKTIVNSHPFIIDNEQLEFNKLNYEEGVYELTKDKLTIEKDKDGNDLEAFWIKGNVSDNSIEILTGMGIHASSKDFLLSYYRDNAIIEENGDFRIPIKEEELELHGYNALAFDLLGFDKALSYYINTNNYTLVKEGETFISVRAEADDDDKNGVEVRKGEDLDLIMSVNNASNASIIASTILFDYGFEVSEVELTDEAEDLLKKHKLKAKLSYEGRDEFVKKAVDIKVDIVDKKGKPANLDIDIPLVEVELKLKDDTEINFTSYITRVESVGAMIKDKDGKNVPTLNAGGTMYDSIRIIPEKSTAVFQANIVEGIGMQVIDDNFDMLRFTEDFWLEDSKGKKYDAKYDYYTASFITNNIPVSNNEYTGIIDVPGHFTSKTKFTPSRLYNGKNISNRQDLGNSEFSHNPIAGETNKDGAIDIIDAINVANNYNKPVTNEEMKNFDFNFDGKIDKADMDYIVKNFGKQNKQIDNPATPKHEHEGKTLDDVLKSIGYNK